MSICSLDCKLDVFAKTLNHKCNAYNGASVSTERVHNFFELIPSNVLGFLAFFCNYAFI
ncbi:hypothetical protein PS925_01369 [Pseudomonas fluorescens]|uniref:Uncharacterized protein n=1 Tax=Pseudomonas fluorescens TaxID=294 RepID=A0A5E7SYW8_PSEFL|nr:hypothetical protein PS847_00927 [Pseudomonas fluorescens]VVP90817.1 hypothetical protein PS925_01369 [Pseudomonas fluorescens]VVQ32536.1 hypothetical protein PS947_03032 [Pseudomonas fluorescens]